MYSGFYSVLSDLFNECFPIKKRRSKPIDVRKPYISQVPVNRGYMCVNFLSSNAMKFFSIDTLFLVSIFDYNMLQILFILLILN